METNLVLHEKTHHITVYSPKSNEAHLSKDKLGKLEIYGGVPAYVKTFIDEHNIDESAHPHIQENLSTLEGTVAEHIEDTNNPHAVTKEQVGLGNVDNTSDANKPISTATQAALDAKANESDLTAHTTNTSNPHNVTKAQVGLGNVDNTSDLNKPISTATQAALDGKQATISDLETIRSGAALGATAVQPGDLATVATTGSYNDLTNKPTIGNATLTIQKNSTTVDTFTANATSNKTINITVPTTAADVDALPDTTKYGASLEMSVNSSTFVVTATLKDQDGNTLGTAQTIDLPLESVVVSGSYDSANKKVVLTLQNGSTIDFSVADLVAGLQSEITSSNKLSADLVDDTNTTHKFVTASDKSTWNGKQDAISDLTTIRSNASAGANAAATIAGYGDIVSHDANEFALDSNTVHKTGDETIAGTKTFTGKVVSPIVETGSNANNYFQCQKFRGEGNASTYYHAIDFGYANHNQVDFYEYGGTFVFHKHTASAVGSGDTIQGTINDNGWEGNVKGNVTGNVTGNLTGNADTATKATQDGDGNVISSTYLKAETDTLGTVLNRGNSATTDIDFNNKDWFNAGVKLTSYYYSTSQDPTTQYYWYKITPPASGSKSDRYLISIESDVNYPSKRGTYLLEISTYGSGTSRSYNVSLNCLGLTGSSSIALFKCAMDASGYVYVQSSAVWTSYMRFIRLGTENDTKTYEQVGLAAFGTAAGFTPLKTITDTGCIRVVNGALSGTYSTVLPSEYFVGNLVGTATKATQDASGNTITSTYSTKAETVTNVTGSNATVSVTKNGSTSTFTIDNVANATNAAAATKATQDGDGNTISSTYLKLSGGTMTGDLKFAGANNRIAGFTITENGNNVDGGWNWANKDGAGFYLRSSSHSAAGEFGFFARNSAGTTKKLIGSVSGSLTWDGNAVQTAAHKGVANGIASLDANTKVPVAQLPVMTGATSSAAGTVGAVPAPAAGDEAKFLRGDGTWVGSTSATIWGSLTGTLSDQTDLQNALNAKQGTLSTAQLNAANSGITSTKVGNYDTHIANSDIHVTAANKTTWDGKQDAISDLATIRSNASSGASAATTIAGYGNIVTHNASEFALDSSTVHTTGNETIGGTKTFSSEVIGVSPAASDDSTKLATTAWVRALLGDINMLGRIDFDSGTQFTISATVTKSKNITGMSTYTILSDGYISLLELSTTGSGDAIISNALLKIIINGATVIRKDFYGFIPVSSGDEVTFSYNSSFALSSMISAGTYMAGNFAFLPQRS